MKKSDDLHSTNTHQKFASFNANQILAKQNHQQNATPPSQQGQQQPSSAARNKNGGLQVLLTSNTQSTAASTILGSNTRKIPLPVTLPSMKRENLQHQKQLNAHMRPSSDISETSSAASKSQNSDTIEDNSKAHSQHVASQQQHQIRNSVWSDNSAPFSNLAVDDANNTNKLTNTQDTLGLSSPFQSASSPNSTPVNAGNNTNNSTSNTSQSYNTTNTSASANANAWAWGGAAKEKRKPDLDNGQRELTSSTKYLGSNAASSSPSQLTYSKSRDWADLDDEDEDDEDYRAPGHSPKQHTEDDPRHSPAQNDTQFWRRRDSGENNQPQTQRAWNNPQDSHLGYASVTLPHDKHHQDSDLPLNNVPVQQPQQKQQVQYHQHQLQHQHQYQLPQQQQQFQHQQQQQMKNQPYVPPQYSHPIQHIQNSPPLTKSDSATYPAHHQHFRQRSQNYQHQPMNLTYDQRGPENEMRTPTSQLSGQLIPPPQPMGIHMVEGHDINDIKMIEEQHERMKKMAEERARIKRQEEEEREREQKERARAKLEELENRIRLKNSNQKLQTESANEHEKSKAISNDVTSSGVDKRTSENNIIPQGFIAATQGTNRIDKSHVTNVPASTQAHFLGITERLPQEQSFDLTASQPSRPSQNLWKQQEEHQVSHKEALDQIRASNNVESRPTASATAPRRGASTEYDDQDHKPKYLLKRNFSNTPSQRQPAGQSEESTAHATRDDGQSLKDTQVQGNRNAISPEQSTTRNQSQMESSDSYQFRTPQRQYRNRRQGERYAQTNNEQYNKVWARNKYDNVAGKIQEESLNRESSYNVVSDHTTRDKPYALQQQDEANNSAPDGPCAEHSSKTCDETGNDKSRSGDRGVTRDGTSNDGYNHRRNTDGYQRARDSTRVQDSSSLGGGKSARGIKSNEPRGGKKIDYQAQFEARQAAKFIISMCLKGATSEEKFIPIRDVKERQIVEYEVLGKMAPQRRKDGIDRNRDNKRNLENATKETVTPRPKVDHCIQTENDESESTEPKSQNQERKYESDIDMDTASARDIACDASDETGEWKDVTNRRKPRLKDTRGKWVMNSGKIQKNLDEEGLRSSTQAQLNTRKEQKNLKAPSFATAEKNYEKNYKKQTSQLTRENYSKFGKDSFNHKESATKKSGPPYVDRPSFKTRKEIFNQRTFGNPEKAPSYSGLTISGVRSNVEDQPGKQVPRQTSCVSGTKTSIPGERHSDSELLNKNGQTRENVTESDLLKVEKDVESNKSREINATTANITSTMTTTTILTSSSGTSGYVQHPGRPNYVSYGSSIRRSQVDGSRGQRFQGSGAGDVENGNISTGGAAASRGSSGIPGTAIKRGKAKYEETLKTDNNDPRVVENGDGVKSSHGNTRKSFPGASFGTDFGKNESCSSKVEDKRGSTTEKPYSSPTEEKNYSSPSLLRDIYQGNGGGRDSGPGGRGASVGGSMGRGGSRGGARGGRPFGGGTKGSINVKTSTGGYPPSAMRHGGREGGGRGGRDNSSMISKGGSINNNRNSANEAGESSSSSKGDVTASNKNATGSLEK